MIHVTLHNLYIALVAVAIRDLWCYCAAQIFCWRKRRETQREAARNRELQQLAAAEELKKQARTAKVMMATASKVPFPELTVGPLVIKARCDHDFLRIVKAMHANFDAQDKTINNADFENN
jgi:hypothetical protein